MAPRTSIFPSLIAAPDILDLRRLIHELDAYCDGYHVDVMDYHFVPNLTWGPMFVNAIRGASTQQIWVDLLVEHPERYLDDMHLQRNDSITFHLESSHADDIIQHIHAKQCFAGVGINPDTPLEKLHPYLDQIDHVLLMSVTPGFSGQEFDPHARERLKEIAHWRETKGYSWYIAMDGGIDATNISQLSRHGVNMFAIGSGIFDFQPQEQIEQLQGLTHS